MAAGDVAIYTEDAGGDTIPTGTAIVFDWDTVVQEDSIYSESGGIIDCNEDGHYLVIYNVNIGQQGTAPSPADRATDSSTLRINGTDTHYGRSGCYYRNDATTGEVGGLHGASIVDLTSGDDLRLAMVRTDGSGTSGAHKRLDNKDGGSRMTIIKLNDDWDYARIRNTTTLGASTTSFADYTWNTNDELDAAYTHSEITNTQNITIEETGLYMVFMNADFLHSNGTSNERVNIESRMMIDTGGGFSEVDGTRVTCFLRGFQNNSLNAVTYKGLHEFNADDIIKFQYAHNSTGTGVSASPIGAIFASCLSIVQLPSTAEVFQIRENGGGARADTDAEISFDTTDREDTDSFDHLSSPDTDVESQVDMYCLAFCTWYHDTNGTRNSSRVQNTVHFRINGTKVGGGASDSGHSNNWAYNRGNVQGDNVESAGASQCGLIDEGPLDTETLTFYSESPGTGADSTVVFPSDFVVAQGLNFGTVFTDFESVDTDVHIDEEAVRARDMARETSTDVHIEESITKAEYKSVATDVHIDETALRVRAMARALGTDVHINEAVLHVPGIIAFVSSDVHIEEAAVSLLSEAQFGVTRLDSATGGAAAMDSHQEH